jgi:hypothetical protein
MNIDLTMNIDLAGIRIPDSKLAREIMELVRDAEPALPLSPFEPLESHASRLERSGCGGESQGVPSQEQLHG